MTAQITARDWVELGAEPQSVWLVEINHTAKRNAMTRQMWKQLRSVFEQLQHNREVRCIVVQGAGEAFCAGGDISEYPDFRFEQPSLASFHENEVWAGLNAILACDIPVVAHIHGACMGAGVEIASCCDVRLSTTDAKFGAPIAKLGFPMAPKELHLVARSVGLHTAQRMLLEAAVFSAQELAAQGWCAQPLALQESLAQVYRTALQIASLAPQAARLNKRTLRALIAGETVQNPYAYASGLEHREGIMAFLEKREPHFQRTE